MSEAEKKKYFYWSTGYVATLFIMMAQLRYMLVLDDQVGLFLVIIGMLCFTSFFRYAESQLFPNKSKTLQIMKRIFIGSVIVIAVIGFFLL
ncbi:hypothetical protein Pryu01_01849 [Paraliobacillus ryukyuensis]|uniref:Uncharacterized protein n=1 Tax=Paraliobacillus ryukyuensis TaxID=200904 RepID=A0A366DTE7_9BACI|nr:hypothetical protein [Paraliobacillus ryukyuensis]RBO93185.1 hypothetical protein DES48_11351 [Paraliobacillus ryukyuensis]